MRIHFSNVDLNSRTGPNTFGGRLKSSLEKKGHKIVGNNEVCDIFLAFIEPNSKPFPKSRLVQRLDGIWFKPEQFNTHNQLIKWTYDNSDFVIWQSNFDKAMTNFHWGEKNGVIINNGIELKEVDIDNPDIIEIRDKYDKIFVCSANWHRQKRLKENVELFLNLRKRHSNSCLIVMGSNPDYVKSDPDIFYVGSISHEDCLQLYSAADWMIHLAWLDHCPNVVVEAMSQNCGVICSDSGGTKEIVRNNGIVITEQHPYNFELADYDSPPPIKISGVNLPESIKINKNHICIDSVADRYIRALEKKWD